MPDCPPARSKTSRSASAKSKWEPMLCGDALGLGSPQRRFLRDVSCNTGVISVSLPCQFCGKSAGMLSSRSNMYRCTNCGTVLCDNCVDVKKGHISVLRTICTLISVVLAFFTVGLTLIIAFFVGFRPSWKACTKCGGRTMKEIS